MEEKYESTQQT